MVMNNQSSKVDEKDTFVSVSAFEGPTSTPGTGCEFVSNSHCLFKRFFDQPASKMTGQDQTFPGKQPGPHWSSGTGASPTVLPGIAVRDIRPGF
jgi:hypothetical protein